jgi:hypothetical protein
MPLTKHRALGAAMALTALALTPVRAELLKNLKTDGSIEVRSFSIDNEADRNATNNDYRSDVRTRILAGATFDLLDDVHSRVLLRKNNHLFGQDASATATPGSPNLGNSSENLNQVQSSLALDNAYVKIDKVFSALDLTIGRQFYTSPEDFAVYLAPNDDDVLSVYSADLFRADAGIGNAVRFQGIAGKLNEATPYSTGATAASNVNQDTDLYGGSVETDAAGPMANLAAFYYTRQNKFPTALGNDTLNLTGAKLSGNLLEGLNYRLDFMQNFGRNNAFAARPAYDGTAYFIGVHYGRSFSSGAQGGTEGMPVRAAFEYGRGTANFQTVSVGPRFGKIWGEQTTVPTAPSMVNRSQPGAGLNDLKVIHGSLGVSPVARLALDAHWYRFRYDVPTAAGLTSAGTEYDIVAAWKHSDNVSFEASWATFQVGDALDNVGGTPTSPITRLGADVKIKF